MTLPCSMYLRVALHPMFNSGIPKSFRDKKIQRKLVRTLQSWSWTRLQQNLLGRPPYGLHPIVCIFLFFADAISFWDQIEVPVVLCASHILVEQKRSMMNAFCHARNYVRSLRHERLILRILGSSDKAALDRCRSKDEWVLNYYASWSLVFSAIMADSK